MKIWMSGEIQEDVYDGYVRAERNIESLINENLKDAQLGDGLVKLAYIAIIKSIESSDYPEIKKYRKRDRTAEFRLKIPHGAFLNARNDMERHRLVAGSLVRAIRLLPEFGIENFDYEGFEANIERTFRDNGWV